MDISRIVQYLPFAVVACAVINLGCGGAGSTQSPAASPRLTSYYATQFPGDTWSWEVGSSTFSADNLTLGHHYDGSVTRLASGFLQLTINSSTNPNVDAGLTTVGLETAGQGIIMRPAGPDTAQPIIGTTHSVGLAGTTDSLTWVSIPSPVYNASVDVTFGQTTFTFDNNGSVQASSHDYYLDASSAGTKNATGQDGFDHFSLGTGTGALNENGLGLVDFGQNLGGWVGVRTPTQPINISDLSSRTFHGFIYDGSVMRPVKIIPSGTNELTAERYLSDSALENDQPSSDAADGVKISFLQQPISGALKGTITPADNSASPAQFVCVANLVNNKAVLYGIGGTSGTTFAVYAIEN